MSQSSDQATKVTLQQAFEFAAAQAERTVASYPDFHPMYTTGGKWGARGESWTHWCEGFFPGILWLVHLVRKDDWSRANAEAYTRRLAPRRFDRDVHDLGFLFLNTYLRWFRLTGEPELQKLVVEAGQTLALRFQPKGEYLCSFLGKQSLFVDIMMNVPVIFYAAKITGDEALWTVARKHCATSAQRLVRADGGTAHEAIFDTETGAFLHESTQQGFRADSTWSRGLAWALYGFGTVFSYTQSPDDLAIAERTADFYLRHTPDGAIPLWDFDAVNDPSSNTLWDSSAAAIAASGLWNLSLLTKDPAKARAYADHARKTLVELSSPPFLAKSDPEQEGILLHGVYHKHKGLGVDESVIWGDHFFVEGLVKVLTDAKTIEV